MTSKKQFKARVRARMAKTGESYTAALKHLTVDDPRVGGWRFLSGVHSASSAVTSALVNAGVPVSEAAVFLAGGGIGAGYILWEFKEHRSAHLVMGFTNRWQYHDSFLCKTLERLGVPHRVHRTGGAKAAAKYLTEELEAGHPCIVLPDRYHIGYWGLPAHLDGYGGHPVLVYRHDAGGVFVDDRGFVPIHVPRESMDAARARVGSYKNFTIALEPAPIGEERLVGAVLEGLRDCAEHLSGTSDSFSLPAWRKWARLTTDRRNAKAWPKVFAGGKGLTGALLSLWEEAGPVGMDGGDLRDLFATGLDEAAVMLGRPALVPLAERFREIHGMWRALADAALPADIPEFARMRDLTTANRHSILTEGRTDIEATTELWRLRVGLASAPLPIDPESLFIEIGERVTAIYTAETSAIADLKAAVAG
ncbi:BtrH N-terminal domain-containing protein [Sinosporangium siamense]|uniref:Butirosin biosynthesis protein H N-terminal domain-containing protein n=1 Tax=Sinosporangium siamense TaxID=1367973 RepID=A0A919R9R3_9ACTN|nr:BtrH N-terminal domain-containing protein [Sinosporangium siamense]GII90006.1 hypothetical protein Ssi02_02370 [Sinosporangium siamense]